MPKQIHDSASDRDLILGHEIHTRVHAPENFTGNRHIPEARDLMIRTVEAASFVGLSFYMSHAKLDDGTVIKATLNHGIQIVDVWLVSDKDKDNKRVAIYRCIPKKDYPQSIVRIDKKLEASIIISDYEEGGNCYCQNNKKTLLSLDIDSSSVYLDGTEISQHATGKLYQNTYLLMDEDGIEIIGIAVVEKKAYCIVVNDTSKHKVFFYSHPVEDDGGTIKFSNCRLDHEIAHNEYRIEKTITAHNEELSLCTFNEDGTKALLTALAGRDHPEGNDDVVTMQDTWTLSISAIVRSNVLQLDIESTPDHKAAYYTLEETDEPLDTSPEKPITFITKVFACGTHKSVPTQRVYEAANAPNGTFHTLKQEYKYSEESIIVSHMLDVNGGDVKSKRTREITGEFEGLPNKGIVRASNKKAYTHPTPAYPTLGDGIVDGYCEYYTMIEMVERSDRENPPHVVHFTYEQNGVYWCKLTSCGGKILWAKDYGMTVDKQDKYTYNYDWVDVEAKLDTPSSVEYLDWWIGYDPIEFGKMAYNKVVYSQIGTSLCPGITTAARGDIRGLDLPDTSGSYKGKSEYKEEYSTPVQFASRQKFSIHAHTKLPSKEHKLNMTGDNKYYPEFPPEPDYNVHGSRYLTIETEYGEADIEGLEARHDDVDDHIDNVYDAEQSFPARDSDPEAETFFFPGVKDRKYLMHVPSPSNNESGESMPNASVCGHPDGFVMYSTNDHFVVSNEDSYDPIGDNITTLWNLYIQETGETIDLLSMYNEALEEYQKDKQDKLEPLKLKDKNRDAAHTFMVEHGLLRRTNDQSS